MPVRETNLPAVEIFRAGEYGDRGTFTPEDLALMASSYDPALLEAPVTLDHDQWGRAYGWIVRAYAQGERLFADLHVHEDLLEDLRAGRYAKRSVEIYKSLKEAGGKIYLKAVSFLGAAAPAVKGMADLQFSADAEHVAIAFAETQTPDPNPGGKKMPDNIVTAEEFAEVKRQLTEAQTAAEAAKTALEQQLAAQRKAAEDAKAEAATFSERLEQVSARLIQSEREREAEKAEAQFSAAFEKAVGEGRVTPAEREALAAVFGALPSTGEVAFGEETISPREAFLRTIAARPANKLTGGRVSKPGAPITRNLDDPAEFSQAAKEEADKLCAADPALDYADALTKASAKLRSNNPTA